MINFINYILESVGLKYNPERHSVSMPYSKKTKAIPIPRTPDPKPEGRIVLNPGLKFDRQFIRKDTDDGFEQDMITRTTGQVHPAGLTPSDMELIKIRNLSESKATQLKKYWSKGVSAEKTSGIFDQRGFGVRTLEKYWSVFHAANRKAESGKHTA